MAINRELALERGLSNDKICQINQLHISRENIQSAMKTFYKDYGVNSSYSNEHIELHLAMCGQRMELIERELQGLWGFEQNVKYTKFWELPACTCPKLDNSDPIYPHPIYNYKCIVHKYRFKEDK